jgi:hypothetical protein
MVVVLALAIAVGAPIAAGAGPGSTSRTTHPQVIKGLVVPKFKNVTNAAGLATTVPDASCGSFVTGAAWGDVNGDGKLDMFVARLTSPSQLFVNDGHGHFTDQAAQYGVQVTNAVGAVFADYDNDGRPDLFVVRTGPDILFHRDATGNHFTDMTAAAGIVDNTYGSSVSAADFDNDGHLDFYVANYAHCSSTDIHDPNFRYEQDQLWHNNGNGTFTNVVSTLENDPTTGTVSTTLGAGFQAAWFDANNDGKQDLYLGNDYIGVKPDPNHMWMNDGLGSDGKWHFQDVSQQSGTKYSMNTMGIGVGDYNHDGRLDLALSNVRYNRLLKNNGDGTFTDVAPDVHVDRRAGQRADQVPITWATAFYDFNDDGWEDLYFAAGNFGYYFTTSNGAQGNELFVNNHGRTFVDMSTQSGAADPGTSKGVAFADYNRDGRMDMYVVNQNGAPHLFQNVTPMGNRHWLEINPVGTVSNRDGCGARMVLTTKTGPEVREVFCGSTSVASGSQRAPLFGLGQQTTGFKLTIFWPSGKKQVLKNLRIDRLMRVVEPS